MTTLSDAFGRTEAPLASGWSTSSGVSGMRADGSVARGNGNSDNASYWSSTTPGDDHWIDCNLPNTIVGGASAAIGVRHNTGGTFTCYMLEMYTGGARIREVTGGSFATLVSQTETLSTTAVYKLDATGTTLTATKDGGNFTGGSLSTTDSSISSGTWCMYMWANYYEPDNHLDIDNVDGDDGAGGGGATFSGWYSNIGGWW